MASGRPDKGSVRGGLTQTLAAGRLHSEIYLLGNILGCFPHICNLLFWVTNPAIIFGIDWLRLDWFLCNPNQLPMAGFPP
jgi:hypothetical protein